MSELDMGAVAPQVDTSAASEPADVSNEALHDDASDEPAEGSPSSPPPKRKLKVKIDDQEEEVDEDEVLKDYQKYKAADKKFQEAATLRKQAAEQRALVEGFLGRAQQGDLSWLKGLVPKEQLTKFAESELLAHIEYEKLSEPEKKALALEQRTKELEEQLSEYNRTKEQAEIASVQDKAYQTLEADIIDAVKELGYSIQATPRFVRRMAELMHASLDLPEGDTDAAPMTAKAARDRAWEGYVADASEVLSVLPTEKAIALIPPKLRSALRKADVQDAVGKPRTQRVKEVDEFDISSSSTPRASGGKYVNMSTDDYFKRLKQKYEGK